MTRSKPRLMAVALLFAIYAFSNLDRYIISVLVTPMKADLHATDFEMSLLMGLAFGLFYSVCGLPMGWVTDNYPRKWIVAGSTAVWGLASFSCGMVTGYAQLFVARMLVGMGESALTPTSYSYLTDSFPVEKLSRALSFFGVAAVIGVSIATLAGGILLGTFSGWGGVTFPIFGHFAPWQAVFLATGLPAVVLALLATTIPEPTRTGKVFQRRPSFGDFLAFLKARRRLALVISGSFVMMMAGSYTLITWAPTYLERAFGWSHRTIGFTFGIMFIAFGATGQAVGGIVVDRLFNKGHLDAALRYFFWSAIIGTAGGVLAFLAPTPVMALAGIGIAQFFIAAFLGYAVSTIQLVTPNEFRGQTSALFLFCTNGIACVVGPAIAGALSTYVFRSEAAIGQAVAIVLAIAGIIAATSAGLGKKHLRQAMKDRPLLGEQLERSRAARAHAA